MHLKQSFTSNVHDIFGETGEAWLKELPQHLEDLADLWGFVFLQPMPNLSYNFVALVRMNATAKTAILKMAPKGGSLIPEMRWLQCIDKGVPELYRHDESLNAYLMQHLEPGESLKGLVRGGDDDKATKIVCQTIRNLQSQHCTNEHFRHLSELAKALSLLDGKFDAKLLSKAKILYQDLTNDRTNDVVLHGDLHHDNILSCGSEWKAIDPHGYIGDPAAEVGAMIRNADDCFPNGYSISKMVERRLSILAEELSFDPQRIKSWAFCMTVLSGAWSVEDHGCVPDIVVQVATAIDPFL
jgi:streptomycin 6-kinase